MINVRQYVFSKFLRCFDFCQKEVSLCLHNNIFRHGNLINFQYQLSYKIRSKRFCKIKKGKRKLPIWFVVHGKRLVERKLWSGFEKGWNLYLWVRCKRKWKDRCGREDISPTGCNCWKPQCCSARYLEIRQESNKLLLLGFKRLYFFFSKIS